ncbi:MAG: putative transcriptional regulatory protein [Chlamydiae bacterium]|nr:putative transcriptional regulatory protein [Chlamydiota bacterium]
MAGHSKWANIKHRKGRADAAKGKIFSRLAKEIISAVKEGGSDPKGNTRLRLAIQKAKEANMPNENVDRNIKKASSKDQSNYDEVTYELYGHGGIGILVDGMTDNRNRFSSEIRIATNKRGGTIATPGSVQFNFDRKGIIQIEKKELDEEAVFAAAIDCGAEDFDQAEELFMVITAPEKLYEVKEALASKDLNALEASITMIPKHFVDCDEETAKSNQALIDWLEDIEDVDLVYHNMNSPV